MYTSRHTKVHIFFIYALIKCQRCVTSRKFKQSENDSIRLNPFPRSEKGNRIIKKDTFA